MSDAAWGCDSWAARSGQDRFVFETFFAHLAWPTSGRFFVEAGANDGLTESNTLAFERCFGWRGLLVEPDARASRQLGTNRPRSLVREGCLAAEGGRGILRRQQGDMNSVLSTTTNKRRDTPLELWIPVDEMEMLEVQCFSLGELLAEQNVRQVDYLSLDTEGSELDILRSLDWSETGPRIQVISVETAVENIGFAKQRQVHSFLQSKGYEFVQRLGFDDIYQRRSPPPAEVWRECDRRIRSRWKVRARNLTALWPQWLQAFRAQGVGGCDAGLTELTSLVAEDDLLEQRCPFASLVARAIVSLAREKAFRTKSVTRLSTLAIEVDQHRTLLSEEQHRLLVSQGLPKGSRDSAGWRGRLPAPPLFVAGLDLWGAALSPWPVFEALDVLSLQLHRRSAKVDNFYATPGGICGSGADMFKPPFAEWRQEACGLFTVVGRQLEMAARRARLGHEALQAASALLSAELALKRAAWKHGLYWLLFFAGGATPGPWKVLQEVSSALQSWGNASDLYRLAASGKAA